MYVTTFTVVGRGHIPADMLRYDQCCPRGSEDVVNMEYARGEDDPRKERRVTLNVYHAAKDRPGITEGRWSSFGWSVSSKSQPRKI